MPQPNKGENKNDFLKRCTAELVDQEGRDSDQAFAMCNAFWDDSKSQRSALTLAAPLSLAQLDGDKPAGFLITAYTGAVIDRGWFGKLVISTDGIKVNAKMPVLREHERDRVVGYSTKAWKENGNLFLQGDFSVKSPDGQEVKGLAEEGFPWQASIGVWPKKVKVLESDKESETVNGQEIMGPAEIWMESHVREVSFCALGADDETAAITLADQDKKVRVHLERSGPKQEEAINMPITLQQLEAEAPDLLTEIRGSARAEGLASGQDEGAKSERARVVKILKADGERQLTMEAIEQGATPEMAFEKFLQAEKAGRAMDLTNLRAAAPGSMGQSAPQTDGQDFEAKVAQAMATGKSRGESIKMAAREFPELHQAYIDRNNPAQTKEG